MVNNGFEFCELSRNDIHQEACHVYINSHLMFQESTGLLNLGNISFLNASMQKSVVLCTRLQTVCATNNFRPGDAVHQGVWAPVLFIFLEELAKRRKLFAWTRF